MLYDRRLSSALHLCESITQHMTKLRGLSVHPYSHVKVIVPILVLCFLRLIQCDSALCDPFRWRDGLLPADTAGLDVCRSVCSNPANLAVKSLCQLRCASRAYASYLCYVRGWRMPCV